MPIRNRKYKDSVFTDLFGSDRDGKRNFLSLYNALSGADYDEDTTVAERKIIEQSLYKTYNNDVSWVIDGKLVVLIEHQSTVNENMPFRCLEYVTRIYESIVPSRTRYAEKSARLPNPDFYVVYVGDKAYPREKVLRLSDSYYEKDSSKLELCVTVRNCSDSRNLPISRNCAILKEYCQFIELVEQNYNARNPQGSFKKAIEAAIESGILAGYLCRKSREVINMLCAKYDYKTDIAVKKEEAFADGLKAGLEQGLSRKATEAAVTLVRDFSIAPELAAEKMGAPLEAVLNALMPAR